MSQVQPTTRCGKIYMIYGNQCRDEADESGLCPFHEKEQYAEDHGLTQCRECLEDKADTVVFNDEDVCAACLPAAKAFVENCGCGNGWSCEICR